MTIIDRFPRCPEIVALRNIKTNPIALTFLNNYFSHFGVPLKVNTDQGTQFPSKFFVTSACHPQTNGMVERFHRQLKATIMAKGFTMKWTDELTLTLGLRCAFKEDILVIFAELVYGQNLRLNGEPLAPSSDLIVQKS